MRKSVFINDEIYHICNRGVEKRNIFSNDKDRFRFIHNLFEMNDSNSADRFRIPIKKASSSQFSEVGPRKIERGKRNSLVYILAFILMPNHFHVLLQQKIDGGVPVFMQKIGTAYAMYFNKKNDRVGPLFQGRYKAVMISEDAHLLYMPHYIHLNALDLIEPKWREGEIADSKKALEFLENYRWSSYLDYIGKKNFPSVINKNHIIDKTPEEYQKEIAEWLQGMEEVNKFPRSGLGNLGKFIKFH
jgi:putative transposase